jgi:putative ABC transport system permease protein
MSLLRLAWKNIINNPLNLLLNIVLFAMGVGLINFLFMVNDQLKEKFDNNLAGIDMVIGAKGSPLQMILCNMYHIDNPTGNIEIGKAKAFLNTKHPLIKKAVPLSIGDSYKGYRIVGTDYSILELYNAEIEQGVKWSSPLEVTIGGIVAKKTGLKLGDNFYSSHGLVDDEDLEHEHSSFKVVGILKNTGSVIDQLILTSSKSVWDVHDHSGDSATATTEEKKIQETDHSHDHSGHDHDDHSGHDHDDHSGHDHDDHSGHDHDDHSGHDHGAHDHADHKSEEQLNLLDYPDKEITSILIQFKNRTNFQALNMPRNINSNTDLQAASPAIEINRLYDMVGVGTRALQSLAILISIVSALSIFISLFSSLKRRKYELALIRVLGGSPSKLFLLIILEGIILALISFVVGILLSHVAMWVMADKMSDAYKYNFNPWHWDKKELFLLLGSLILGFIASVIPAVRAYRTDIHKTLSKI